MTREFVAYDEMGTVVAAREAKRNETLEDFAARYPGNTVAEVDNNREVRVIEPTAYPGPHYRNPPDQDENYRRDMIAAGRGHLLR